MSGKILADVLDSFSPFGRKKAIKTTGFAFRLLTTYSVGLLSIFICVILMNRLYGDAIECFPSDSRFAMAIQLKCWIEGVFLDHSLMSELAIPGQNVLKTGVGHNHDREGITRITFRFYQWIVPVLLLQAFIFYLPHAFWHHAEKHTMHKLLGNVSFPIFSEEWEKQRSSLIVYVKDVKGRYHRGYALKYLLSEIFALACLVFNVFLIKWIIQHEKADFWSGYAPAVSSFLRGDITEFNLRAAILFPTQGKCDFNMYGSSGTIEERDALCILPQNVIIDKIFVFIYIWYIFAIICGILNLIYLLLMYLFTVLRIFDIGYMLERLVTIRECKGISNNGDFGLWLTLKIYHRNLVPIQFQDLCKELHAELKHEGRVKNASFEVDDLEKY